MLFLKHPLKTHAFLTCLLTWHASLNKLLMKYERECHHNENLYDGRASIPSTEGRWLESQLLYTHQNVRVNRQILQILMKILKLMLLHVEENMTLFC